MALATIPSVSTPAAAVPVESALAAAAPIDSVTDAVGSAPVHVMKAKHAAEGTESLEVVAEFQAAPPLVPRFTLSPPPRTPAVSTFHLNRAYLAGCQDAYRCVEESIARHRPLGITY
ncbi:hypothetical protein FGB62_353g01 [Gracilaria domingensis]|nr:hypothetical protein FGB62_353g01 [Gracilaria domingensis]